MQIFSFLAPAVRWYIRYAPTTLFKEFSWRRVHWRQREYIARTRFGATMQGSALDLVQGYIYYFGIWEPNLTAFIRRRLKDARGGRTFLDVGANVGYFSLLAASQMPNGRVVSIEAHPDIYKKLHANLSLNRYPNIRTIQCAAAASECEIHIYYGGAGNEGATTTAWIPSDPGSGVKVRGSALPNLLTAAEVASIILIKIDVEGAEHEVVKGMQPMLNKLRDDAEIVLEIIPSGEDNSISRTMDVFRAAGYVAYSLENSYAPISYLKPSPIRRPKRLQPSDKIPSDVVLSKIDAEFL